MNDQQHLTQLPDSADSAGAFAARPLAATATWLHVMRAAGGMCQCTGSCGNLHTKSGRRCDARSTPQHRLSAGPADPMTPPTVAACLPEDQLRAWCPGCWSGTLRRFRAASARFEARQRDDQADTLF